MNQERLFKETRLAQRGLVVWLFGLSGAGKSTLVGLLDQRLQKMGHYTMILDGDVLRAGINSDLGFSDLDRLENIRRASQIARLFCQNGTIVLASFITPQERLRELARNIVGPEDLVTVYLRCSYETCASRDVKGLYAKARLNQIPNFTGKDSSFEEPGLCDLIINTADQTPEECLAKVMNHIEARLRLASSNAG